MIPVYEPWLTDLEKTYAKQAIDSGWISSRGEFVDRIEEKFAKLFGFKHAIAVNTGTAALHIALLVAGISPGDEVLVPNITFVATPNAVRYCGAVPVLVDIDSNTWNIDIEDAKGRITDNTRGIIPVHLYGSMANMDGIKRLIGESPNPRIALVEDACEALGAKYNGHFAGSFSKVAAFSFFGNKTITTGEGGMVVTNDDEIAYQCRILKGQGQTKQYWHPVVGYNYRMTNIQAAIGLAQLERWDEIVEQKKRVYEFYQNHLKPDVKRQGVLYKATHGYWMNAIYVTNPVVLGDVLRANGIDTRPSFYQLSDMPPYKNGRLMKNSKAVAEHSIILPSSPLLTDDQLSFICNMINKWA